MLSSSMGAARVGRRLRVACAALVAALPSSCVDTSPDRVQLSASIEDPSLSVSEQTLVAVLDGSFDLVLELGDLASDDSTVEESPSISLVRAENNELVRLIDAVPENDSFPVTVTVGETRTLAMTLTSDNTLPSAETADVCAAGELQLVGTLRESLSGNRTVSFSSAPFFLSGCP